MSGELVEWRPGVTTRLLAAASTGATQVCAFEQWCEPGTGAPAHAHPGVEELVTVLEGEADFWADESTRRLGAGECVLVSPGTRHGFSNAGRGILHTLAVFAHPAPPVVYEDEPGLVYEVGGLGSRERRDAHRALRQS